MDPAPSDSMDIAKTRSAIHLISPTEKNNTMTNQAGNFPSSKCTTALAIVAIMMGLSACSAHGQRFDPNLLAAAGEKSAIVIYRNSAVYGILNTPGISIDGQGKGSLKSGGWIGAAVAPGQHVIGIDRWYREATDPDPISLETLPGQAYFVRFDLNGPVVKDIPITKAIPRNKFSIVPREKALAELEILNQSN